MDANDCVRRPQVLLPGNGVNRAGGDPLERSLGFRAFYEWAIAEIVELMHS